MDCSMRSVKYVSDGLLCYSSYGLSYYPEPSLHDVFKDTFIRNRVILRFDLMKQLRRYFDDSTIQERRMQIFRLLMRDYTDEEFSGNLIELAGIDFIFARALKNLQNTIPVNSTFGDHIISTLTGSITDKIEQCMEFYKGLPTFVIGDDYGYLYISIPDKYEPVILLDENYEEVSNAKSWDGQIDRV